jgi:serine kinase of HPr protein (carbohydrate metabolism regulator)
MIRHAGLVAKRRNGRWVGVLIEGASGSGKSDLVLRALAEGFRLVADDRAIVWASGGRLYGRVAPPLADLVEAHGVGVVREPQAPLTEIVLVVRLMQGPHERMPEPDTIEIDHVSLPVIDLDGRQASAPAKLSRALDHLGERGR